jgi:ATP-binding cassette subfamily B protein
MRCWSCERENPAGVRFCARCGAGLACPDCGAPMTGGQRFCTHCGRRLPVRGPQTAARPIEQRVQHTPHFRIHYPAESYAEQQIGQIADRLEAAYATMVNVLALQGRAPAPVDVFLAEWQQDPSTPDVPRTTGGFATPGAAVIHEVFRPDAPGVTLERSLAQLLLSVAIGPSETPLPLFAVEGLLGWLSERLGPLAVSSTNGGAAGRPSAELVKQLQAQGQLPHIATIIAGPVAGTEPMYPLLATALTTFLIRRYRLPKFLTFARTVNPTDPGPAARAAFGESLEKIEKEWRRSGRGGEGGGILRFIRAAVPYLLRYKLKVGEILVYLGLSVAFATLLPLSQKWLIDRALLPGNARELARIMGGITALFVVVSLTSLRETYISAWVAESILKEMRLRIFGLLQRMEPAFFERIQTGDIISRMSSDLLQIQFAFTGALAEGLRLILTLIVALVTIFVLDWRLGLVGVAGLPLFFLTTKFLGPPAARSAFRRQQDLATVSSTLQENLLAQPVVKAFGLEQRATGRYRAQLDQLFRSSLRLTFLSSIYGLSANSIASAIQLSVLGAGGYLIIRGDLTLGGLLAFLGLMGQLIGPVQSISGIMQALQQATGAMDRVDELIKLTPGITDRAGARAIPRLQRAIRFEHVYFSYTGVQPTIQDLMLEVPAGSTVALVGPSGCGKSTVLHLLLRFYEPNGGRITFDGIDIEEATLESLRGQIGVVFQDSFLFDLSIRENIRMGRLDATDAEVEAAGHAAEIDDLIASLPQGYDTVVGERGGRLSGGQRQRIAIARAIVRNPAVLLLDEATSALDSRTEAAINRTLARLATGRTTVMVTHRLTSAAHADRIYVLDRGRLVEHGTHDELLKGEGLYAKLWHEQTGGIAGMPAPIIGGLEAERLAGVPLFAGLDGDLLAALAGRLTLERFAAGDVVVRQGDHGDTMYCIHRGMAEVFVQDPAGTQRRLAELRPGEYFGEMALLYDVPRTATVRAVTPLQALVLTRADLTALMTAVPDLRPMLEHTVAERIPALRGDRG